MTEQRLGPPPVETLGDIGWARVERNLFARVEGTVTNAVAARDISAPSSAGSRNPLVWLAVPAAAAAAFALAFFSMNGNGGTPSATNDRSRVAAGAAPSTVTFGDAHITLDARSSVILDRSGGTSTATLEDGTATIAVAPHGTALTVQVGDVTARTSDATFDVHRQGERADVRVTTGTLEIRFRGHDLRLTASQHWTTDHPDVVSE